VVDIRSDGEFECIKEELRPILLDVTAADVHQGDIERSIRTMKEKVRSIVHGLPYNRLPKAIIRAAVNLAVRSLNQFPAQDGVSKDMSPLTIMTGAGRVDYNQLKLEFGTYAMIFEDNDPSNTDPCHCTGPGLQRIG